jgi:hypothetical protein
MLKHICARPDNNFNLSNLLFDVAIAKRISLYSSNCASTI